MLRRNQHHLRWAEPSVSPDLPTTTKLALKHSSRAWCWWMLLVVGLIIGTIFLLRGFHLGKNTQYPFQDIREYPILSPLSPLPRYPFVTVITTLVKADDYIDGFLENILNQSWPSNKYEVLLLNIEDLVSDYVLDACKRAQKSSPHLKLLDLPRVNLYEGWNFAIEHSKGEYITISNPDDRRHPYSIERQAGFLLEHSEYSLVCNAVVATRTPNQNLSAALADPSTEVWWRTTGAGFELRLPLMFQWDRWGRLEGSMNFPHAHPMWRRSLHTTIGLFDVREDPLSDFALWVRALAQGERAFLLSEPLSVYYINNASYGRAGPTEKLVQRIFEQIQKNLTCRSLDVWLVVDSLPTKLINQSKASQVRLWQLLRHTVSAGHNVTIVSRRSEGTLEAAINGATVKEVGDHGLLSLSDALRSLATLPDVIVSQLTWDGSLEINAAEAVLQVLSDAMEDSLDWPMVVLMADDDFSHRFAWERSAVRQSADRWATEHVQKRQRAAMQRADLVLSGNAPALTSEPETARVASFPFDLRDLVPTDNKKTGFSHRAGLVFVSLEFSASRAAALEWLLSAVLPLVRKSIPDITVTIVGDSRWARYQQRDSSVRAEPVSRLLSVLRIARVAFDPEAANVTHTGELNPHCGLNLDAAVAFASSQAPIVGSAFALRGLCCNETVRERWAQLAVSYPTATDFARKLVRLYIDENMWTELTNLEDEMVQNCFHTQHSSKDIYSSFLRTVSRMSCPITPQGGPPPVGFPWVSVTQWESRTYTRKAL